MNKTAILLILITLPFICVSLPLGSVNCTTVSGTSMEPALTQNDIAVFAPVDKPLEIGDIISFEYSTGSNKFNIAHRIIGITDEGYKTKGDSLQFEDNYIVTPESINGVMLFKIPYIVAVGHFTQTVPGFLLLIFLPASIIVVEELRKIKKLRRLK